MPGLIDPTSNADMTKNIVMFRGAFSDSVVFYANRVNPVTLTTNGALTAPRTLSVPDASGIIALRCGHQSNSTAADLSALVADFNSLLAKLRASGVMSPT